MGKLRYVNTQWRGDLRWPFDRTAMTTIKDDGGRRVSSSGPERHGGQWKCSTAYGGICDPQYSYPVSERIHHH